MYLLSQRRRRAKGQAGCVYYFLEVPLLLSVKLSIRHPAQKNHQGKIVPKVETIADQPCFRPLFDIPVRPGNIVPEKNKTSAMHPVLLINSKVLHPLRNLEQINFCLMSPVANHFGTLTAIRL